MTQTIGLIGHPLGHSISPTFQQAAFDHLGLDMRYELWDTEPDDLSKVVDSIYLNENLGANVTVPYKEKVLPLLNIVDEVAGKIGAVNTIVKKSGKLIGYNTDAEGFLRSLQMEGKFDPAGKRLTMIGAGGVARAIIFIMIKAGVKLIKIFDIDIARAERLANDLKGVEVVVLGSNKTSEFKRAIGEADLLVNCTPIGMKHSSAESLSPVPEGMISPVSLVVDVVYNPLETPFLKMARKSGARTIGGLPMLVYQGATSFELWTECPAPVEIMMQKAQCGLLR